MKALLIALLVSSTQVYAQETNQDRDMRQECISIAQKLYPDVVDAGSPLIQEVTKLEKIMKGRDSTIADLPQEPLILAGCAAEILRIQPKWSALSEDEKQMAYHSFSDAMVFARDLAPIGAENQAISRPQIGIGALDCYLYEITSGHTDGHGLFVSGPAQGQTRDQAAMFARQQWLQMTDGQKMPYEKMAEETGDPIAQQQAAQANAPVPVRILQGQGQ